MGTYLGYMGTYPGYMGTYPGYMAHNDQHLATSHGLNPLPATFVQIDTLSWGEGVL